MMRTQTFFELHARYVWPFMRHLVRLSRRCRNCLLSERHGPLEGGVCEACRRAGHVSTDVRTEAGPDAMAAFESEMRTLAPASGPGRYDSLLMLSGGKDSAYILHRLRTEYPQHRILCLMVDNGFSSPSAIQGAALAARKTGTDLLLETSSTAEFRRVIRRAFLDLKGRGAYGVVDFADGELIFEIGKRVALDFGIPRVIGGLSWAQVRMIVGIEDTQGAGCFELRRPGEPRILFPLAIWRPGEEEIRSEVRRLGLLPAASDSPVRSNSDLILAMSVLDIMNLGYSSFEPEFAQMIREGKADRRTWLHLFELLEFATRRGLLTADLNRVLDLLDLQLSEVCNT